MNYNPLRQLRMFIQSSTGEISNNKNEIEAAKESILVLQRTKEEVVKKGRESVITSYSIHYTKLYDPIILFFGRLRN